jgi:hypothetical protein
MQTNKKGRKKKMRMIVGPMNDRWDLLVTVMGLFLSIPPTRYQDGPNLFNQRIGGMTLSKK